MSPPSLPKGVNYTDLTGITRESDKIRTEVFLRVNYRWVLWLSMGAANLLKETRGHTLTSRMDATDFEHDSVYAVSLPLIGLKFESHVNATTTFSAFIKPNDLQDFCVPVDSSYDPTKQPGVVECGLEDCDPKHVIVPEEFYTPPSDAKLFEAVRGYAVEIVIRPSSLV